MKNENVGGKTRTNIVKKTCHTPPSKEAEKRCEILIKKTVYLFIIETPIAFTRHVRDTVCEEMDCIALECHVNKPDISVAWTKNEVMIEESEK